MPEAYYPHREGQVGNTRAADPIHLLKAEWSLTLYILRHLALRDVLRLTAEMLLGTWRNDEALSIESVDAVTIDTRKSLLKVMFDGEVETLQTPLEFSIRTQALCVLVQEGDTAVTPERHLAVRSAAALAPRSR